MNIERRACLLTVLVLLHLVSIAQKFNDHKWSKARENTTLSAELVGKDAVFIYQYRTIANHIADLYHGALQTKETVMRRVKVNTKLGIDEHSVIHVQKRKRDKLEVLDARTIKPDGKVIDLSSKDIKRLDIGRSRFSDDSWEELRFTVPGVEIGDEVEMVYTIVTSGLREGYDAYFHSRLPVLRSVFVLVTDKEIKAEIRGVNDPGEPDVQKDDRTISYRWEMANLSGVDGEDFAVLSETLPHVTFCVREIVIESASERRTYPVAPNSAANMFDIYVRAFSLDKGADHGARDKLEELKVRFPGDTKVGLLGRFHSYVTDSIAIVDLPAEEVQQPLKFHLERGRIDPWNLERLWWNVFHEVGLDGWVCFGRRRHDGGLDPAFLSPHMISSTFFAVMDEARQWHFVYPSNSARIYEFDEIPWYLEGTSLLLVRKNRYSDINAQVVQLNAVRSAQEQNAKLDATSLFVDVQARTLRGRHRRTYSGHEAIRPRSELPNALSNGFGQQVLDPDGRFGKLDSIELKEVKHEAPFRVNVAFASVPTMTIGELEDGLFTLELAQLIGHDVLEIEDTTRSTTLDVPYAYADEVRLRIVFNTAVELPELMTLRRTERSAVASYTLSATQVDERTLDVISRYELNAARIDPAQFAGLVKANRELDKARAAKLVFKVL